ncbi:MAG TPA: gamma-glutamyl-gamma-aminobutyrate hydrolase family protein [Geminicoccaceae bacterium]
MQPSDLDASWPSVGVPACLVPRDHFHFHQAGDKYVDAVLDGARGLPLVIPALGARLDPDLVLDRLDGLMLTGSPSNVGAQHYGGPAARADDIADPARDATTLPLIRRALERGVPLFAICRGIQELNVALGGSLHQHVHEIAGRRDHRSDKTRPAAERYGPVHRVTLTPGGLLQTILDGAQEIEVNSLHAQGIDRPAGRLVIEAQADDGTIEAVSVAGGRGFALGVQWHPEWRVLDNPISRRLFAAFGEACRAYARAKASDERHGVLAPGA